MIKKFTIGFCAVFAFTTVAMFSGQAIGGEMDLVLRQMARAGQSMAPAPWSKALGAGGVSRTVPCLIRTLDADVTAAAVEFAGGSAKIITGDIVSANIPAEKLSEVIAGPEVVNAEASVSSDQKNEHGPAIIAVLLVCSPTADMVEKMLSLVSWIILSTGPILIFWGMKGLRGFNI